MNDITRKHLQNIIENRKFHLNGINNFIEDLQRKLVERVDERNELAEEIKALEKDLND